MHKVAYNLLPRSQAVPSRPTDAAMREGVVDIVIEWDAVESVVGPQVRPNLAH